MKLYNLVMIFNPKKDKVLMCLRNKEPYKNLYNFIGGKIEKDEEYLSSAYRELFEETGIKETDVELKPFIDYTWHMLDMSMYVFIGKLNKEVTLIEEVHELFWVDITEDFFDMNKYAGEGNIGHMIQIYFQYSDIV